MYDQALTWTPDLNESVQEGTSTDESNGENKFI